MGNKVRSARVVIGAGWGDEGKGLLTDHYSHEAIMTEPGRATVIRYNGGAQAGHTVQTPDGRRHVFHHIGAGTLAGADTHLSRYFVAHPMVSEEEIGALERLGVRFSRPGEGHGAKLSISPDSPVTTPFEALINQIAEVHRGRANGGGRHGSTGLGFGETIEREEKGPSLTVRDLGRHDLRERLEGIRGDWLPRRLEALGVEPYLLAHRDALKDHRIVERFLQDAARFLQRFEIIADSDVAERDTEAALIFEGAQGLQLDMDMGAFPHVTRSNTGLRNVVALSAEMGITRLETTYVTRAYATRHGAGPLPFEGPIDDFAQVLDETNQPNAWQGWIRHAPLDVTGLCTIIEKDRALVAGDGIEINRTLAVTCLDQLGGLVRVGMAGQLETIPRGHLDHFLSDATMIDAGPRSFGPTRATLTGPDPTSSRAA